MKSRTGKQTSQYDKILKENLEAVIPILIQKVLGIQTIESEELPDDLQHTKERKPDALKRMTDMSGQVFILHLEFQVANEPKMVHRMHNYCAMLLEQYELPVRQYVFYLGTRPARMTTSLVMDNLSFHYNLISLQDIDYQLFLTSTIPEEVLLAVLANFQPQDSSQVLTQLLSRLNETASGPLVFQKYIAQLRVLIQLRNLRPLLETAMDDITKFINEQNDPFYIKGHRLGFLQGTEKGIQQGIQKGIREGEEAGETKAQLKIANNLIAGTSFSDEEISRLTGVSQKVIKKVRQQSNGK